MWIGNGILQLDPQVGQVDLDCGAEAFQMHEADLHIGICTRWNLLPSSEPKGGPFYRPADKIEPKCVLASTTCLSSFSASADNAIGNICLVTRSLLKADERNIKFINRSITT